jgi:hypothetical protein
MGYLVTCCFTVRLPPIVRGTRVGRSVCSPACGRGAPRRLARSAIEQPPFPLNRGRTHFAAPTCAWVAPFCLPCADRQPRPLRRPSTAPRAGLRATAGRRRRRRGASARGHARLRGEEGRPATQRGAGGSACRNPACRNPPHSRALRRFSFARSVHYKHNCQLLIALCRQALAKNSQPSA